MSDRAPQEPGCLGIWWLAACLSGLALLAAIAAIGAKVNWTAP